MCHYAQFVGAFVGAHFEPQTYFLPPTKISITLARKPSASGQRFARVREQHLLEKQGKKQLTIIIENNYGYYDIQISLIPK